MNYRGINFYKIKLFSVKMKELKKLLGEKIMNILEKLKQSNIEADLTCNISGQKVMLVEEVETEIELQTIAVTKIMGVYKFIINHSNSGLILAEYIVFENGMVAHAFELGNRLVESLNYAEWYDEETKVLELNEGSKDDDYRSLDSLLKEHNDLIAFMKNEAEPEELLNSPLYVQVVGEREVVDGKTYHEEGVFSDKITEKAEFYNGVDDVNEIEIKRHYRVLSSEKRYVKVGGWKFRKLKVYKLEGTSKLAIETYSVFASSDVFIMDVSEVEIY